MITFAYKLKTQPNRVRFRHVLPFAVMFAFLAFSIGCQDSANQPPSAWDASTDGPESGNAGIVASMDSVSSTSIPADGQRVGDVITLPVQNELQNLNNRPNAAENRENGGLAPLNEASAESSSSVPAARLLDKFDDSTVAQEVRDTLQRIQLLRGSEITAIGAAELEVRRRRNFRIIDLATRALPVAMSSSDGQGGFLQLIRFLLEARLELAVSGNAEDIQSLYADVKALTQRDPSSETAAEGIYTLARFAHEMARRNGDVEPVWFNNFCQWAREFANRFPSQRRRATALLLGSARSCELRSLESSGIDQSASLMDLATENYEQLVAQFPDSTEANEATAVLRRLNLPGQELTQFSGQTIDSQPIDSRTFVDIVTVVYFWDANDPEFRNELLPLLQQAADVADGQLRFVGVSLTNSQADFSEFLQRNRVPGTQMFGTDPQHRGWNHPVVRFWGLSRGCTCWLIKHDRTVAAVDIRANELVDQMRALFPSANTNAEESLGP